MASEAYLKVLEADPQAHCATQGLNEITRARAREEALCSEGAVLDEAKKPDEADERYAAALGQNVGSECAKKGLAPDDDMRVWDRIGDAVTYLPKIPAALGALLLIVFGVAAIGALAWAVSRRRRPSLVVRAFADGAVDSKIGAGFAALVEERLLALARKGRRARSTTYDLDLVVADVELLAEEEDLAQAVGGIAEIPQLQIAVAVLSFVDRLVGKRRLALGGELLPEGDGGHGVALALYRRNAVRARGALWEEEVADWMPIAAPPPVPAGAGPAAPGGDATPPPPDPRPYFRLAAAAAAWGQYEAGRDLDASVDVLTESSESFALVSLGLELHRDGDLAAAAELYAHALGYDQDNVAALVNLALALSRLTGMYVWSVLLLARAEQAIRRRYEIDRLERRGLWRYAAEAAPR